MPLPRSLTHVKPEVSEKKWAEAHQWARGQTSRKKFILSWDRPGPRTKGSLQYAASARTADEKPRQCVSRHDLPGCIRVDNEYTKKVSRSSAMHQTMHIRLSS